MHFAFLSESTMIAAIPTAIDRQVDSAASAFRNDMLMSQAPEAQRSGQIWLISRQAGAYLKDAPYLPGARDPRTLRIFSSIQEASLTLDIFDGLELGLASICRSEADAQTLATAMRGMMALTRLGAPPRGRSMLGLLDKLQISDFTDTIEAELSLTVNELDGWIQVFESNTRNRAD